MEKKEINMAITETGGSYKANVRLKLTDDMDICFIRPLEFTKGYIGSAPVYISNVEQFRELCKIMYEVFVEGVKNADFGNSDFQKLKAELFCSGNKISDKK